MTALVLLPKVRHVPVRADYSSWQGIDDTSPKSNNVP